MNSVIVKTDWNDVLVGMGSVLVFRSIFPISFSSNQVSASVIQGIRESYHLLFPVKERVLSTSLVLPCVSILRLALCIVTLCFNSQLLYSVTFLN